MHDVVDDVSKVNAAKDTDDEGQIIRRGTLNDDDRKWMEQNSRL